MPSLRQILWKKVSHRKACSDFQECPWLASDKIHLRDVLQRHQRDQHFSEVSKAAHVSKDEIVQMQSDVCCASQNNPENSRTYAHSTVTPHLDECVGFDVWDGDPELDFCDLEALACLTEEGAIASAACEETPTAMLYGTSDLAIYDNSSTESILVEYEAFNNHQSPSVLALRRVSRIHETEIGGVDFFDSIFSDQVVGGDPSPPRPEPSELFSSPRMRLTDGRVLESFGWTHDTTATSQLSPRKATLSHNDQLMSQLDCETFDPAILLLDSSKVANNLHVPENQQNEWYGKAVMEPLILPQHLTEGQNLRPLYSNIGKSAVPRNIWELSIMSRGPNLFSNQTDQSLKGWTSSRADPQSHSFGFDEHCRSRLVRHIFPSFVQPQNSSASMRSEIPTSKSTSPCDEALFPSVEALSACLRLYFRNFHPLMPFIHRPTFQAPGTDPTLLTTMCLIGFTFLNDDNSERCISTLLPATIRACRRQLTSNTCQEHLSTGLLDHLASAMLLLCTCHMASASLYGSQARPIYFESMSLVKRHNIFPWDADYQTFQTMLQGASDLERWQAWARVESAKRLCVCLLMGDAMFSHEYEVKPILRFELLRLKFIVPGMLPAFEAHGLVSWRRLLPMASAGHGGSVKIQTMSLPRSIGNYEMHGLLAICWAQVSEGQHHLLAHDDLPQPQPPDPEKPLNERSQAYMAATVLSDLYDAYQNEFSTLNPNCLVSWHNDCMNLASERRLFQDATGKNGPNRAQEALRSLARWSSTIYARRACLHAAQTFRLMGQHKISDGMMFQSETALFESALVLGFYMYLQPEPTKIEEAIVLSSSKGYEILDDDVDWTLIGPLGLLPEVTIPPGCQDCQHPHALQSLGGGGEVTFKQCGRKATGALINSSQSSNAREFILHGFPDVSFEDIACPRGFTSAQRIFLAFCTLLKQVAPWNAGRYCQILRVLSACDI
jgi:hypothetical protein